MEKQRREKALVVVVLLVVIAGLTVAFAALSTTLNINGTAYLDAAKWGIRFENLSSPTRVGKATTTGTAKIEETKAAEITDMNVSLSIPGDKIVYTVDLVNKGTINAKIDNIEKTVLTSEQQRYLTFKVTDKDGYEIKQGDILEKGETKKITITIEFIKDLTKEDLPKQTSTISLSYKLNFVQTDEKVTSAGQGAQQACTSFDKKDTYNVGDVIALCNTDTGKSEDFYVIKDNGDTVTALAKYNLLVGNIVTYNWDSGESFSVPISKSEIGYGLQNAESANYTYNDAGFPDTNIIKGAISFSESNYWVDSSNKLLSKYGSNYPADVFDSNSNLYEPLENYKAYLKNTLGKTSIATNLMTRKNLINLGCDADKNQCTSAQSFVYSVNYWTISSYDEKQMWNVLSANYFAYYVNYYDQLLGLRPVITISKSEL